MKKRRTKVLKFGGSVEEVTRGICEISNASRKCRIGRRRIVKSKKLIDYKKARERI